MAKPGDGECLWTHAPKGDRDIIAHAATSGDFAGLANISDPEEWLDGAIAACGIAPDKRAIASGLWESISGREFALAALSQGDTAMRSRLLQAVANVSVEDRRRLKVAFTSEATGHPSQNADAEAAADMLAKMAAELQLAPPAMDMLVMLILQDQSVRELEAEL